MSVTTRNTITCDGILGDGSPCPNEVTSDGTPVNPPPLPENWIKWTGRTSVGKAGGGENAIDFDLHFCSEDCEQRYHDGPYTTDLEAALA